MSKRAPQYLSPESTLTLAAGLEEYYGSRHDLAVGRGLSPAAREFFRCHDAAHVVFGCDTTLPSEGCIKMWSFFGTDAGFGKLLAGYKLAESKEIYDKLTLRQMINAGLVSLAMVPRVILRSWRMHRKSPWAEFDSLRERTLKDLRSEFGIEVIYPPY